MKRRAALLLIMAMAFALCACGKSTVPSDTEKVPPSETGNSQQVIETANVSTPASPASNNDSEAQLAVEGFEITQVENDGKFYFTVKLRNITDKDLEQISFDYQLLDKNGDILGDQTCGANNVAAGQAIWAGPYKIKLDASHIDEIDSVCFVSSPAWLKSRTPLNEKVSFQIKDYMK